jgi:putative N6-adenine-specific DNA methylase
MADTPEKKSTLTLKTRANTAGAESREPARQKTGARAHQKARLAVEAKKLTAVAQKKEQPRARPTPTSKPYRSEAPAAHERFEAFAPCPKGLEHVLAQELKALHFNGVTVARAGCHFEGSWTTIQAANLHSRIATRILVKVGERLVRSESDIFALAREIEWERWFGAEKTLRVDTSAIRSPMKSLQYCNLIAKDGICDRLREREGARPSIDTVRPDARVHLFLSETTATLYLDTSGESLFKRGWRFDKGEAPIRENLAAGLLMLAGWQPSEALIDPFCGSGTILIEAAWMSLNIPPGINRPFSFERLRNHDKEAWQTMRQVATENIRESCEAPLVGFDVSEDAIHAARSNLVRAGLRENTVEFSVADACDVTPVRPTGRVVTNPPYGERLQADNELMQAWATHLKQAFGHWHVHVISADLALESTLRLKSNRRTPVFNGALDCRLYEFDILPPRTPSTELS